MGQYKGTVAWFNDKKGFGFLKVDGQRDVFCHYTAIESSGFRFLKDGDAVEFDILEGRNGPQAANVRRLRGLPQFSYQVT